MTFAGSGKMKVAKAAVILAAAAVLGGAANSDSYWGSDSQFAGDYPRSVALCGQVRGLQPSATDRPDAATASALKGCNTEALYYGIGKAGDPVKARQCAFLHAAHPSDHSPFDGDVVLMMIYANGLGAPRNLDLAMHYACGIDGAPAEYDGRVQHLAELKTKPTKTAFDYCDDITSGLAGGYCAARDADRAKAVRDGKLAKLVASWTPAERSAFGPLTVAYEAYVQAHSRKEVDLSGTLRGAFVVEAEEAVRADFLDKLTKLSAGQVPQLDLKVEDAKLNKAYRAMMQTSEDQLGAVRHTDIRSAERTWLAYRDAFLAFAKVKAPSAPSSSIAAWLTQARTKILQRQEGREG